MSQQISFPERPNYRTPVLRLCASLQRKGVAIEPLLQELGISPQLADDPLANVSGQQMILMLKGVNAALQDEFLGLTEHRMKPGSFNFMIETGLRCGTLDALLAQCQRFMDLVTDDLMLEVQREQDQVVLSMRLRRPELDPDHFLIDHLLLFWHRVLSWTVGYLIPVTRVDMRLTEPPSPERLHYWIRADWQSGQARDALYFNERYLTLPVVRSFLEWQEQLKNGANGHPQWPEGEQRWCWRLKALLRLDLTQRRVPSSLKLSSAALGLSSQTLRRHLRDENTSYQQVLDALRRDMAIEKLHLQHLAVADVAEQLGFSEARSFSRAFKQWTGVSPSRYTAISAP